jgi:hypothetical protein
VQSVPELFPRTSQLELAEAADMTWQDNEKDIREIKTTLKWHWGAIALLGGALFYIVTWYLPKELDSHEKTIVSQIKLEINKVAKLQLTKLSAQIEDARNQNIKIDSATLISLSSSISDVAVDSTPEIARLALKANADILSYKSFLNVGYEPPTRTPLKIVGPKMQLGNYHFAINLHPNTAINPPPPVLAVTVTTSGTAMAENSARLESLYEPQPVSNIALIVIQGRTDTVMLDGEYMKNVIIKDAVVGYDGGPTRLENVYFVNCKFVLSPKLIENRGFNDAVLAKVPTSYRTPSA